MPGRGLDIEDVLCAEGHGRPEPPGEVGPRLWALCSPLAVGAYGPPWGAVAASLWGRLTALLGSDPKALAVAAGASRLGYDQCAAALRRGAPALYGVVSEVRSLALVAAPALVDAARPQNAPLPGVALEYEALTPL
jgi:hypothetical protein